MSCEKYNDDGYRIYTRREMLSLIARSGAGIAATSVGLAALDWLAPEVNAANSARTKYHPAKFFKKLPGGKVKCTLCPRKVTIPEGKNCFCRSRRNLGGKLYAMGYGKPCIVNFEPVERAPLYHFLPETQSMSLGIAGCNMNCLYCQNYELAQAAPENVRQIDLDPQKVFRKGKIDSITLTYTDASCQPEYLVYLAQIAKKAGLKVIMCTGGYINSKPFKSIIPYVDALAITLKAATDETYKKLTGVHLKPVLKTIKRAKKSGKWLEVVTLVVPGYTDDRKGIEYMSGWIHDNLGDEVPWHLSRFTPNYKLRKLPPTPRRTLEEARQVGLDAGLKFVYITNLAPHTGNNTYCPKCHKAIIERLGFKTTKMHLKNGKCAYCGTAIPGVWS